MTFDEVMAETGKKYLREVLERNGWIVANAVREVGLSRQHIYKLMRKYNLYRPGSEPQIIEPQIASRMTPEFRRFLGLN